MKKYVIALLSSLTLTVLSGCSQSADMPPQAEGEAAQWRTEGFAAPGKLEEEQTLWAGEYLTWEHKSQTSVAETKDLLRLDSGVCGELLWYFGAEPGDDGSLVTGLEGKYVLEIYDTSSGETTVKQFSLEELGLEDGSGALYSMDMPDEEHYVFRRMGCEPNEEGMYRQTLDQMIYVDLAGNIQIADFRDIYLEKGIYQEMFSEYPLLQSLNWRCDGKGNICVIDYREKGSFVFYLFDQSGDTLLECEGTAEQLLVEPLRTNDGELIFPVYNNAEKCYEFLWADTAERELRSLARIETSYPDISQMYGMLGDDIYYRSQEITTDGIVKWDIRSGRRVRVFDFQEAGIASGYEILLALREGQTPVLHLTKYRLLEYTCTDMSAVSTNEAAWLNEGKDILWGYFFTESDFLDFFAHMEAEGGRLAGFPTEGACGSYLMADGGVLVVNANIAQKAAAACFLEFLLGEEMQSKPTMLCMSVRRLVPEDYIVEGEAGKLFFMGNERSEVPVFRDGDTSLHRAKAFLENCVALPRQYPQIVRILAEELSAMYAEGRSPETTAKHINSRVQLYLDEGN